MLVTPAKKGKCRKINVSTDSQDRASEEGRVAMTWAQRLKRVFDIDVDTCDQCGGAAREIVWVIACIEDPMVIKKILDHLDKIATTEQEWLPQS